VSDDDRDVSRVIADAFACLRIHVTKTADPARLREALDYLATLQHAVEDSFQAVLRIARPPGS